MCIRLWKMTVYLQRPKTLVPFKGMYCFSHSKCTFCIHLSPWPIRKCTQKQISQGHLPWIYKYVLFGLGSTSHWNQTWLLQYVHNTWYHCCKRSWSLKMWISYEGFQCINYGLWMQCSSCWAAISIFAHIMLFIDAVMWSLWFFVVSLQSQIVLALPACFLLMSSIKGWETQTRNKSISSQSSIFGSPQMHGRRWDADCGPFQTDWLTDSMHLSDVSRYRQLSGSPSLWTMTGWRRDGRGIHLPSTAPITLTSRSRQRHLRASLSNLCAIFSCWSILLGPGSNWQVTYWI